MPLLSSLSTIVITFIIGFIIMVVVFVGSDVLLTPVGKYSLLKFVYRQVVVVLLFYVHGQHLRSCRDGQLT